MNLKKALRIFHKYLCSFIKFIHDHKKTRVIAKLLGNWHFHIVFGGFQYQHTHILFVEDLKLFATNMCNIKCRLNTVTLFLKDIGMKFGVDKYAFVQIEKGKMIQYPKPLIINDLIIKHYQQVILIFILEMTKI